MTYKRVITTTPSQNFLEVEKSNGTEEIVVMEEPMTTLWLSELEEGEKYTFVLKGSVLDVNQDYRRVTEIIPIDE